MLPLQNLSTFKIEKALLIGCEHALSEAYLSYSSAFYPFKNVKAG
jgi:hypothetical protein